jgi:hypothetical protein
VPTALEDVQRLGLAARAVESEHELAPQPLAKRVLGDELVELRHELPVPPGVEVGVEALLQRGQPQLLDARDRVLRERLVAEVRQRLAPEEPERLPEKGRAPARIALPPRAFEQPCEAVGVELPLGDPQQVPRLTRLDRLLPECLAEGRDVAVKGGRGRLRRVVAPQRLDDRVGGDDVVCVEQEQRQERAPFRAFGGEVSALGGDLERAEDPKLQTSLIVPPALRGARGALAAR